jgi:hypothetical protein
MVKLARPETNREGSCKIYYPFKVFFIAALTIEEIIRRVLPALLFFSVLILNH